MALFRAPLCVIYAVVIGALLITAAYVPWLSFDLEIKAGPVSESTVLTMGFLTDRVSSSISMSGSSPVQSEHSTAQSGTKDADSCSAAVALFIVGGVVCFLAAAIVLATGSGGRQVLW